MTRFCLLFCLIWTVLKGDSCILVALPFIITNILLYAYSMGDNSPQLIHLSLGNSLTSMIVVWSTDNHTKCFVQYDVIRRLRCRRTANVSQLADDSEKTLSFIHRAELVNLQENQTYLYQVVCEGQHSDVRSEIHTFKTLSGEKEQTVNLLVYGDMGVTSGKTTLSALEDELATGHYQAVFHNGDLGYDLNSDGGATGDKFLRLIEPIATRFPYMTSPGNHELASDLHHYRHRFSMPGIPWPMPIDKLWYSFDIGPVHFISYSTEVYFIHNQDYTCDQYHWLLNDLAAANKNRDATPWIIAMGHRPMYCSNSNFDDCTPHFWGQWVKAGLEDLFYGMGVDLIIEAHEHSYERLWPVYQSDVVQHSYINPRAPVHVISGAGGNNEGVDWMGRSSSWSAFRADGRSRNSYGRLSIVNRTHLCFDQVNAVTKEVLDEFWMVQETHGPFIPDIDCTKNTTWHTLCTCPPPIRFLTLAIFLGIALVAVIVCSILLCCYSCNCCYNCCCCTCFLQTGSGNALNCRRHSDDRRLINTEIDELVFNQPTETIDHYDTTLLL